MDTIQKALAAVYGMLGGNLDNIRDVDTVDGLLFAIASLGVGDALKAAEDLPTYPEDDGTYTLQLVMDDGEATLTWEAAAEAGT